MIERSPVFFFGGYETYAIRRRLVPTTRTLFDDSPYSLALATGLGFASQSRENAPHRAVLQLTTADSCPHGLADRHRVRLESRH